VNVVEKSEKWFVPVFLSVDNLLKRVWEKQGFCGQFFHKTVFHTVFKGVPSTYPHGSCGKQS
jgi:hypothetical protein